MKFNKLRILVTTFSDIIGNTMQLIALNFLSGSVFQITRGGTIATTFFFSIVFLKNKANRHQIIGSILAVIGILTVGISKKYFQV
jgi:drug/metabolite transporter (DMT)-like permease